MRYYIIAGEASGDLHGSNLIKELKSQDAAADIRAWGGDKMQAAGAMVVKHIRDLAFMGFWEVITNLQTIFSNIAFCKKDILDFHPNVVILVDYPGFNFRLLQFLKENKIPIFYYISPQVWAWKENRVHTIKKYVDRLFVIFPFEVDFYKKYGYDVSYHGHPLLDELKDKTIPMAKENMIALLPGSRKQEIKRVLPIYLSIIPNFPQYKFIIAGVSVIEKEFYQKIIADKNCELVIDATYTILQKSTAAIVTSGTATLETALFRVPEVVAYKGNFLSYAIAKQLIKNIRFIAIVNLIMNRAIVKELIQTELTTEKLTTALAAILNPAVQEQLQKDYLELQQQLGGAGASAKIAAEMIARLKK